MRNDTLIRILMATCEDLVALGYQSEFYFDNPDFQAIAQHAPELTHKAKFFVANRRLNQLTSVIHELQTNPRYNSHEF